MAAPQIDLISDTSTRPSPEMREFMCRAKVGDEQLREDPSVNQLQDMVAKLTGKQAALFLPSGTMCNEIAVRVHCEPGDEVIGDKTFHVWNYEVGGAAALSGALVYPVDGRCGMFSAEQLAKAIRPHSNHMPRSRMIVVEQTSNMGGGSVWPLEEIMAVCETAREHDLACHMDGARLMNAVVASGISAQEFSAPFDSVWIDLSKGLGCPVGAVLAGSNEFIEKAWRWKHQFGGAMRQAGIIAAAGIFALQHNVERIAEDHAAAQQLAAGLANTLGIEVEPVETNIVFFDVSKTNLDARQFTAHLAKLGVRVGPCGPTRVRAVTHLDVTMQDIDSALTAIQNLIS